MKLRIFLTVASVVAALLSAPALADIYVLVEPDGAVSFANAPTDARYVLYLREPKEGSVGVVKSTNIYANPLLAQRPYQIHVLAAAKEHRIDPALVHAVIAAESNYNPNAVSRKGAVGLMQLMPDTARRYGVRAHELKLPAMNIKTGTRYLADLVRLFDGDLTLALAGYNAGENQVVRYGKKIPPYAETQAYVPRVLQVYAQLRAGVERGAP